MCTGMCRRMHQTASTIFLYHSPPCFFLEGWSLAELGLCISQLGWQSACSGDLSVSVPSGLGLQACLRAFCFFLLGHWDPSSGPHDCLAGVPALWAASLSSPFTCFFLYLDKWRPLTLMKLTPPSISLPLFVFLMLCLKNPNPSKIIKDCFPPVYSQSSVAFSFLALTISCDPS